MLGLIFMLVTANILIVELDFLLHVSEWTLMIHAGNVHQSSNLSLLQEPSNYTPYQVTSRIQDNIIVLGIHKINSV